MREDGEVLIFLNLTKKGGFQPFTLIDIIPNGIREFVTTIIFQTVLISMFCYQLSATLRLKIANFKCIITVIKVPKPVLSNPLAQRGET